MMMASWDSSLLLDLPLSLQYESKAMSDDDIATNWYRLRQLIRIFKVLVVNKAEEEEVYADTYAGSIAPFVRRWGLLLLFKRLQRLARVHKHFQSYCSCNIAGEVHHLLIARRSIQMLVKFTFNSIEKAVKASARRKKIRLYVTKGLVAKERRFIDVLKGALAKKYVIYNKKMTSIAYRPLMLGFLSELRNCSAYSTHSAQITVSAMTFNALKLQASSLGRLKGHALRRRRLAADITKAGFAFLENVFIRLCYAVSKCRHVRRHSKRGSDNAISIRKFFNKLRFYKRLSRRASAAIIDAMALLRKRQAMLKLVKLLKAKYVRSIHRAAIARYSNSAYRFRKLSGGFSANREFVRVKVFSRNTFFKKGLELYERNRKYEYLLVKWGQQFMKRRNKRMNAEIMSKFLYEKTAVNKFVVQMNCFIGHIVRRNRELMIKSIFFWKIFKSILAFKRFKQNVIRKQKRRTEKIINKLQNVHNISAKSDVNIAPSRQSQDYESNLYENESTFGNMLWKHHGTLNNTNNENSKYLSNSIFEHQINTLKSYTDNLARGGAGVAITDAGSSSSSSSSNMQHLLKAKPVTECPDNIQLPPAMSLSGASFGSHISGDSKKELAREIINFVEFELLSLDTSK